MLLLIVYLNLCIKSQKSLTFAMSQPSEDFFFKLTKICHIIK